MIDDYIKDILKFFEQEKEAKLYVSEDGIFNIRFCVMVNKNSQARFFLSVKEIKELKKIVPERIMEGE